MTDEELEYMRADIFAREMDYDSRTMHMSYHVFDDPAINAILLKHGRRCLPALKKRLEESKEAGWEGEGVDKSSPWFLLMLAGRLISYEVPKESRGRLEDLVDYAIAAITTYLENSVKRTHIVVKIEDESTTPWHVAIRHDNGMIQLVSEGHSTREAAEKDRIHTESHSIGEGTLG